MTALRGHNPMPALLHIWRGRVVFAVALSMMSVGVLAPGTAQASCGSYVISGKQPGVGQVPLADHSGQPRPCSGPNCSNRPFIPPLTAVPSVRMPGNEASGIAAFAILAETSSAPLAESRSPQHPLPHPRAIFHPPRLPSHSR